MTSSLTIVVLVVSCLASSLGRVIYYTVPENGKVVLECAHEKVNAGQILWIKDKMAVMSLDGEDFFHFATLLDPKVRDAYRLEATDKVSSLIIDKAAIADENKMHPTQYKCLVDLVFERKFQLAVVKRDLECAVERSDLSQPRYVDSVARIECSITKDQQPSGAVVFMLFVGEENVANSTRTGLELWKLKRNVARVDFELPLPERYHGLPVRVEIATAFTERNIEARITESLRLTYGFELKCPESSKYVLESTREPPPGCRLLSGTLVRKERLANLTADYVVETLHETDVGGKHVYDLRMRKENADDLSYPRSNASFAVRDIQNVVDATLQIDVFKMPEVVCAESGFASTLDLGEGGVVHWNCSVESFPVSEDISAVFDAALKPFQLSGHLRNGSDYSHRIDLRLEADPWNETAVERFLDGLGYERTSTEEEWDGIEHETVTADARNRRGGGWPWEWQDESGPATLTDSEEDKTENVSITAIETDSTPNATPLNIRLASFSAFTERIHTRSNLSIGYDGGFFEENFDVPLPSVELVFAPRRLTCQEKVTVKSIPFEIRCGILSVPALTSSRVKITSPSRVYANRLGGRFVFNGTAGYGNGFVVAVDDRDAVGGSAEEILVRVDETLEAVVKVFYGTEVDIVVPTPESPVKKRERGDENEKGSKDGRNPNPNEPDEPQGREIAMTGENREEGGRSGGKSMFSLGDWTKSDWFWPVVGVVAGVFVLTAGIATFALFRRRTTAPASRMPDYVVNPRENDEGYNARQNSAVSVFTSSYEEEDVENHPPTTNKEHFDRNNHNVKDRSSEERVEGTDKEKEEAKDETEVDTDILVENDVVEIPVNTNNTNNNVNANEDDACVVVDPAENSNYNNNNNNDDGSGNEDDEWTDEIGEDDTIVIPIHSDDLPDKTVRVFPVEFSSSWVSPRKSEEQTPVNI